MRLKEYFDDFRALPDPVKYLVYFLIGGLILFCLFQSASNSIADKRAESLEKKNAELTVSAAQNETRAKAAEENAANEVANRKLAEESLKSLQKEIKKSDEKIITQSKKSVSIRADISRVRSAKPKRADEGDIRRKIEARYGPAIDAR